MYLRNLVLNVMKKLILILTYFQILEHYYEIGSDCYYFEIIKDWNNKK